MIDLIIPVKEAEARIVMDSTKVADGTEKPEDILNDGTPQDDIKIPEKKDHGTSPVPEEDVSIRKIQEDMASTIAPSNNNLMDSIPQNEGLGRVAHQVSPNRQPLLAAQFEEKLESSPSNEVVYICVNATCDANNTMDRSSGEVDTGAKYDSCERDSHSEHQSGSAVRYGVPGV